jgi:hypothetical protein
VAIAVGKTLIPDTFGITQVITTVHYTRKGELQVSEISDLKYETWFTNAYPVLTEEESALCLARWVNEGCKL